MATPGVRRGFLRVQISRLVFMTYSTQPEAVDDLFVQGTACVAQGEFEKALDCFEKVRMARPLFAEVYISLASTLVRLDRLPEAAARYREAAALVPGNADIQHNLGCVLEQMHRLEDAVVCYREAVRLNPLADGSYNNLANNLNSLGRFSEAHEAWRRAIALAPETAIYYRNFVQSKSLRTDDPCFVSMEQLVQRADSLAEDNQAHLHFAFGQALADTGQNDRSFEHFLKGNALHRRRVNYNESMTLGLFRDLAGLVSADIVRAKGQLGDPSDSPVFVVGMPRSGSTLIEQILASHPQVFGVGERPDFAQAMINYIARSPDDVDKINLDALHDVSAAQLAPLGADYVRRVRAAVPGHSDAGDASDASFEQRYKRIVDKYPFNFINLGLIHLALPNARFIHSRRAPLETCLSIFSRIFHDVPFGYDLGELGRYYRAYDALMAHWMRVLPEGVMIEVQYEELVDDFEGNVRRMLAHCGLEWDEACLAFHQTPRQVSTASASQVRQPIYRTSIERWHPAPELLQPLYDGLGPVLAGHGQAEGDSRNSGTAG